MALGLRPYQIVGRDFLASRTRALLADEMRVGKTPQAILACEKIGAKTVLVVCPAIAVAHWWREWDKWSPKSQVRLQVMSYDYLRAHKYTFDWEKWDVLIVDECHFAKNPSAQRTKLIYGKGGLGYNANHIWALSGTPAPKHAGDLWPMLRAFGVVGQPYKKFIETYCTGFLNAWGKFQITGTNRERVPQLREMLSKIMLRRTRKQVAPDMPAIDFQYLEVDPEMLPVPISVPEKLSDVRLLAWLEQHRNLDTQNRVETAKAKVICLFDEIEFCVRNKLLKQFVAFGWHVEPLTVLHSLLSADGLRVGLITGATPLKERERIQAEFKTGLLEGVVANILAAGTAIDLSAASHAYFLELDWVPGNNLQAVNRLVSVEKEEPVTVDIVTWPGTVDERIQSVLLRRVRELNQLIGGYKA